MVLMLPLMINLSISIFLSFVMFWLLNVRLWHAVTRNSGNVLSRVATNGILILI